MTRKIAFLLCLLGIAAAAIPSAAADLDKGWWIIVGSFPTEPLRNDFDRMEATAARCGIRIFNDFSSKFRGFAPGYNVFVIGAFASRGEAEHHMRIARQCFAGAYLKYGEYAGE